MNEQNMNASNIPPVQPPVLSHKEFFVLILIAVALIPTSILMYRQMRPPRTDIPVVSEKVETSPTPDISMAGWKTYRNDKFGFEILLPPHWVDVKIEEDGPRKVPTNDYQGAVSFSLKNASGEYQVIFSAIVYDTKEWNDKLKLAYSEDPGGPQIEMPSNGSFTVVYALGRDYPKYDEVANDSTSYGEIAALFRKGFRFLK